MNGDLSTTTGSYGDGEVGGHRTPITPLNFTVDAFREFLLTYLLEEVLFCELHAGLDNGKSYYCLSAFGKLMHGYYLVQVRSDDGAFEDLQIIQLLLNLFDPILLAIHPKW